MLPEQLGRLLSAYVDGELSPDQVNAVHRLLKHSAEARLLLGQLQANVRRLRSLPQAVLPQDLSQAIIERLPVRISRPPSKLRVPARTARFWLGLAAAAFLLAVTSTSYIYFSQRQVEGPAAKRLSDVQVAARPGDLADAAPPVMAEHPRKPDKVTITAAPPPIKARNLGAERGKAPQPEQSPIPAPVLGAPPSKPETLKSITLPVALNIRLRDLVQAKQQEQFLQELRQQRGHQLAFECRDTGPAMEELLAAFQSSGVRVVLDQDAQDRLNLKGLKTPNFYVYSESLAPEELLTMLMKVQDSDVKAEAKKRGTAQLGDFAANALTEDDYRTLSRSLGVPAAYLEGSEPWTAEMDELPSPPTETAKSVPKTKKGHKDKRTNPSPMPIEPGEPAALVVVADSRIHPTTPSPSVRFFFAGRSPEPRSEVKRYLFVLRTKKD
jgi:hypothetical protein